MPALRALRDAFPGHRIILAAPSALAPLAELGGAVDETFDAAPLAPLDAALHEPDVAVNLHGRGPQSHRVLLEARPRRLIAFAHPEVPATRDGPVWQPGEHEVVRWCRMLEESGVAADRTRLDLPTPSTAAHAYAGATVVHPGAASQARRWPPERFAAVARAELQADRSVVLTGSEAERPLAESVARQAGLPATAVAAGDTTLVELAGIVATAGRVVCGDTGVGHLATAFRTPSVVLFGPVSPQEWGPPVDRGGRHRSLWAGRDGDPHGPVTDPGLLEIDVSTVLKAIAELPGDAPRVERADEERGEQAPRATAAGAR